MNGSPAHAPIRTWVLQEVGSPKRDCPQPEHLHVPGFYRKWGRQCGTVPDTDLGLAGDLPSPRPSAVHHDRKLAAVNLVVPGSNLENRIIRRRRILEEEEEDR